MFAVKNHQCPQDIHGPFLTKMKGVTLVVSLSDISIPLVSVVVHEYDAMKLPGRFSIKFSVL